MDVLKDGSAAAIYGTRGTNGVIIITTKKGQGGKPKVTYTGSFSLQHASKKVPVMSATELMDFYAQAFPQGTETGNRINELKGNAQTNWQDLWYWGDKVKKLQEEGMEGNWHLGLWGFLVAELTEEISIPGVMKIGQTTSDPVIDLDGDAASIDELYALNTATLEDVYPTKAKEDAGELPTFSFEGKCNVAPAVKVARPKVLIPVFPGTNCEFDSARAVERAGAEAEIFVIRNLTADAVAKSVELFSDKVKESQMIFIPGGFSGGDEPDGSAKFITAFFRNPAIKEQVTKLLEERDGLMCGICNGFQALIKLGLVPYGKIIDTDENCPTLTFNNINRHQSRIVHTRIASTKSPWLSLMNVGDIVNVPISHGEGKFLASPELALELARNGQIATQYVDLNGNVTSNIDFNPNGSIFAIEGITSPDGRVLGKMGHSERIAPGIYKNVPGEYDIRMFEAAVKYFKG